VNWICKAGKRAYLVALVMKTWWRVGRLILFSLPLFLYMPPLVFLLSLFFFFLLFLRLHSPSSFFFFVCSLSPCFHFLCSLCARLSWSRCLKTKMLMREGWLTNVPLCFCFFVSSLVLSAGFLSVSMFFFFFSSLLLWLSLCLFFFSLLFLSVYPLVLGVFCFSPLCDFL